MSAEAESALRTQNSAAIAEIARGYEDAGNVAASRVLLEAACASWTHGGLWNNLGMARSRDGDAIEAVEAYSRAIEAGHSSFLNRGLAYEAVGDWDAAESDYDRALEIDPSDADALINSGTLRLGRERIEQAIELLERAASIDPAAHWQLADAYLAANRPAEALMALNVAIGAGEQRAHHDRALLTAKTRPNTEVENDFEIAIAAGSTDAARDYAIFLDVEENDPDRAILVAREAVARGDTRCYAPLAVILESLGQLDEALRYYRLAVAEGEEVYREDLEALEQQLNSRDVDENT